MIKYIDSFLNQITMYRVVLYGLIALSIVSLILGATGILFYSPLAQLTSLLVLVVACYGSNIFFARVFKAVTNVESSFITAFILFFLLMPVSTVVGLQTQIVAAVIAMGSKYFFAWDHKHIFNPAALAAFALGIMGSSSVIWWIGSDVLLPFTLIVGLLVVRKIRRFTLFLTFVGVSLLTIGLFSWLNHIPLFTAWWQSFVSWPLVFFGTIMLTEPLTMPPTKKLQMLYVTIVGLFFGSQFDFGPLFSTPELALLVGNVFAFIVSPRLRLTLNLGARKQIAHETYEFIFNTNHPFSFTAGQYFEWTLPHAHPDSRGNRRYFTIASSPTDHFLKLVVRIGDKASSFKQALLAMKPHDQIVASQLAGDFVMPTDVTEKLVFIAGGIGVTPFMSMISYLLATKQRRDIVLLYANKVEADIADSALFEQAKKAIGLKTVYVLTSVDDIAPNWKGQKGRITEEMIKVEVADYQNRTYYLSGPNAMVDAYKKLLAGLGIPHHRIITDYFPGF